MTSRRCSNSIIALLLLLSCSSLHRAAAAARPLRAVAPLAHQVAENGAKTAAAAAADGRLVLLQNGAVVRGDDELPVSEMLGSEAEEEGKVSCEEGDDECLQRRLLRDAHLDYIYTQHKGNKP